MTQSQRLNFFNLAALTAASAAILCSAPAQYLGRQQDDLLYIIATQALSRGSYRLFTSPGLPALVMVNPGFPILLLPIAVLAHGNFGFYQAFCALLLAACPWILWLWLRRRIDDIAALGICLIFSLNPVVLAQAGTVMSEAPFFLLTIALLLVLEKDRRTVSAASAAVTGGLFLYLTQLRMAALAFLPAALIAPVRQRRWRDAAWILFLPALGLAAFALWSYSAGRSVSKMDELLYSYQGHGLLRPVYVMMGNAQYYLSLWGSSCLPDRWQNYSLCLGALLAAISVKGCLTLLRKDKGDPAAWLLISVVLLHAVWPWQYGRYLILPLPFLLWTLAVGAGRWRYWILAGLFVFQAAFRSPVWIEKRTGWSTPELSQTYQWLRTETPDSAILSSLLYVRDGFYARRMNLPLPDLPDVQEFHSRLKENHVGFILWENDVDFGLSLHHTANISRRISAIHAMLGDEGLFRPVYKNPSEGSTVYAPR